MPVVRIALECHEAASLKTPEEATRARQRPEQRASNCADARTSSGLADDEDRPPLGERQLLTVRRELPAGRYLRTVPSLGVIARMLWTSRVGSKRAVLMLTGLRKRDRKAKDLAELMTLLQQGVIRPVIDKHFDVEEVTAAHRLVESGHKRGSVVVSL